MTKPLILAQHPTEATEFYCPLCAETRSIYIFGSSQFRIYRCAGCTLTFGQSSLPSSLPFLTALTRRPSSPSQTATEYASIAARLEPSSFPGPVLVFCEADADLRRRIVARGVTVAKVASPDDVSAGSWGGPYDGAVVTDAMMQVADPRAALTKIRSCLRPGAPLVLTLPLLDSDPARLKGQTWQYWHARNHWYFSRKTLNLLLLAAGFEKIWFETERRRLRLPSARATVTAVASVPNPECVVSIIVPAYNEGSTFKPLMDALLAKQLPGLRKQIIIVESNSSDGTREIVRAYEGHPEVSIIWQPKPRGKGNAVREGLRAATGDIVIIQDADLEYDLDDYDDLLAPLLSWQTMFVLGSRHQGDWKIRKFNDAPVTAIMFNFAHWFYTSLFNLVLHTKMSDPFTMFKICRRDALYGLNLSGNRFDFDNELVVKLVRKGYVPTEVPVNYTSRSHAEGKKITIWRDGLNIPWIILKSLLAPIGPTT